MTQKLAKHAVSVQETLKSLGLPCKVLELSSSTRTAADAALSIGCKPGQIVKSLVFKTGKSKKPILVLASGPNQVDTRILESLLGEGVKKADAEYVKKMTGFTIGGIPPLGHKELIDLIYIDEDLMALNEVWAAAGTPHAVFCIHTKELLQATNGTVVALSHKGSRND